MTKLGVYVCSSKSPVFIRSCIAQIVLQSKKPDCIAIHQNGLLSNWDWAFSDIIPSSIEVYSRHTKGIVKEPFFYLTPLKALYVMGCTHFAKVDDDDIFYSNHLETLFSYFNQQGQATCDLEYKTEPDIVTPKYGDVLEPKFPRFKNIDWFFNPTKAMSDSVMFNRRFAEAYIDLLSKGGNETSGPWDDCIMGEVIREGGFNVMRPEHDATAVYVINGENTSGDLRGNVGYRPQREAIIKERMSHLLKKEGN